MHGFVLHLQKLGFIYRKIVSPKMSFVYTLDARLYYCSFPAWHENILKKPLIAHRITRQTRHFPKTSENMLQFGCIDSVGNAPLIMEE